MGLTVEAVEIARRCQSGVGQGGRLDAKPEPQAGPGWSPARIGECLPVELNGHGAGIATVVASRARGSRHRR